MAGPLRVAVWSTGWIGSLAIRSVHRRPDLDLVGVWVHSPDKVGRDVGELVGLDPIGLAATGDADSLIALRPDCVVYAASGSTPSPSPTTSACWRRGSTSSP